jgi:hypothetical protein
MSLKDINERLERIEKQNKYILGNQISILEKSCQFYEF